MSDDNIVTLPIQPLPSLVLEARRRQEIALNEVARRVRDSTLSSCVQLCLDLAAAGESAQSCADALRRIQLGLAEADKHGIPDNVIPGAFGEPR